MSEKSRAHLRRFRHNVSLADRLATSLPGDRDWVCVVRFYAALHLLDAYLSTKTFSFEIDQHGKRNMRSSAT